MTSLIDQTGLILERAGYQTWQLSLASWNCLGFEDANILGIVFPFDKTSGLVANWQEAEDALLARFGNTFRQAGEKAWNVYCVLLTQDRASDQETRRVRAIEENLTQTRKLAAHSLMSEDSIRAALLPILPLRSKPELSAIDASKRLAVRIENLAPGVADLVMRENTSADEILARLGGSV